MHLVKNPISTVFQLSQKQVTRFIRQATRRNQDKISWTILTLVVALVVFSNISYAGKLPIGATLLSNNTLGGPLDASLGSVGVLQGTGILGEPKEEEELGDNPLYISNSNSIIGLNAPQGYASQQTPIIREYILTSQESLDSISKKFNISKETLAIANNIKDLSAPIQANSVLKILPIDGIEVEIQEEETIEKIAKKYGVSAQDIKAYNNLGQSLAFGTSIIVPKAQVPNEEKPFYTAPTTPKRRAKQNVGANMNSSLETKLASAENLDSNSSGSFSFPTTGRNWGRIHSNNGVDISNSCGTPIYASADGIITTSQDGWNGGYGNYIKIAHPNAVITLYGHLSSRAVQVGSSVSKGQYIGAMGNTGNSTGCHLHFEVRGAKNPLAR